MGPFNTPPPTTRPKLNIALHVVLGTLVDDPPPPPASPNAGEKQPGLKGMWPRHSSSGDNQLSRDALEWKGPQRRPQKRLGRRLEEVAKAVGGGYCRLQMPLKLALAVRETVAGHRLGALEGGAGGYLPPFQCPCSRVLSCVWTTAQCPPPHPFLRASLGSTALLNVIQLG